MHVFKDAAGRAWEVVIDVAAVRRVRAAVGLDLLALAENGARPLGELLGDAVLVVEVLYVLCEPQAKAASVSDEDFGRLFAGDVLEAATDAFTEELVDFFPRRLREAMRRMLAKARDLSARMLTQVEAKIDAIDLDSLVTTLNASSGKPPASSVSTPATSPCDSSS